MEYGSEKSGRMIPKISKTDLIAAVIMLSVPLVLVGSTMALSLFQPVREEAVHLSGDIQYIPPKRPPFAALEYGGKHYSVNTARFVDGQGLKFFDNHRPEKIISIEGFRFYTPLSYRDTPQGLVIQQIEYVEDGRHQVLVVPPEQLAVALRDKRLEPWLDRLVCYGMYLTACGSLYVFYRKEKLKGKSK